MVGAEGRFDVLDEPVHAQALDHSGDLGSGAVGQQGAEVSDLEAADVELAADDGEQELGVEGVEEVEPLVAAVGVVDGLGQPLELLAAGGGVVEGREEFEIATVGGAEQVAQDAEAVDGLLDGREHHLAGAVAVFHAAVVTEEGDVVGDGLDTEHATELVVHLERGAAHLMADAGALDPGVEVVADLAGVACIELLAEEGGDLLGTDGVHGGADQRVVEGGQVLGPFEYDVGGVLHLVEWAHVGTRR